MKAYTLVSMFLLFMMSGLHAAGAEKSADVTSRPALKAVLFVHQAVGSPLLGEPVGFSEVATLEHAGSEVFEVSPAAAKTKPLYTLVDTSGKVAEVLYGFKYTDGTIIPALHTHLPRGWEHYEIASVPKSLGDAVCYTPRGSGHEKGEDS